MDVRMFKNYALLELPGILRGKTMDDKLIYIPNDDTKNNPSVD